MDPNLPISHSLHQNLNTQEVLAPVYATALYYFLNWNWSFHHLDNLSLFPLHPGKIIYLDLWRTSHSANKLSTIHQVWLVAIGPTRQIYEQLVLKKSHFFALFGLPRTFVKTLFSWIFGFPRYLRPLSYIFLWVSGCFLHLASSGTLFLIGKLQHSKRFNNLWIRKLPSMRRNYIIPLELQNLEVCVPNPNTPHCSCGLLATKISNAMNDLDLGGLYGPY